ncbi:MAG: BrnA antitoxin family protein, partial [Albidovulum sp.]
MDLSHAVPEIGVAPPSRLRPASVPHPSRQGARAVHAALTRRVARFARPKGTRPMPRPTSADTRRAEKYHELALTVRDLEADLRWGFDNSPRIPRAWFEIAQRPVVPQKAKLTLRIDEDIVAFLRATGVGHLSRMNAVLRVFMLARLAGVVTGAESVRYQPTLEEEEMTLRR